LRHARAHDGRGRGSRRAVSVGPAGGIPARILGEDRRVGSPRQPHWLRGKCGRAAQADLPREAGDGARHRSRGWRGGAGRQRGDAVLPGRGLAVLAPDPRSPAVGVVIVVDGDAAVAAAEGVLTDGWTTATPAAVAFAEVATALPPRAGVACGTWTGMGASERST